MRLIVLTSDKPINNELAIVNSLLKNGLQRLHIRKPLFDRSSYIQYINEIDPTYHNRIVIHDCFSLFHTFKLGGIHLNSTVRNNPDMWQTIQDIAPAAISTSFHSWNEIVDNDFQYGYVFISPVFDSISKEGYKGAIVIKDIHETRKKLAAMHKYCPSIIGLGGIHKDVLPDLQNNEFDGAALLGGIWNTAAPLAAYKEIAAII